MTKKYERILTAIEMNFMQCGQLNINKSCKKYVGVCRLFSSNKKNVEWDRSRCAESNRKKNNNKHLYCSMNELNMNIKFFAL